MCYYFKGFCGECLALFDGSFPVLFCQQFFDFRVFFFCCHDQYIAEVFCCGADHGRAADIYFFDDLFFITGGGYGLFKRIKAHNHEIEFGNAVLFHFPEMGFIVAFTEYAAKHERVQCFHAAAENGRVAGQLLHRHHGYAQLFDERLCTTGRINGGSELM